MSDGVSIDLSELHKLATDFGRADKGVLKDVDAAAKKGAQNLKDAYVDQVKASHHFSPRRGGGLAGSISYSSDYRPGRVQYEIGPDKDRRGGLGNIFFFGGAHGGGGTGDLDGPLNDEGPRFQKALGDIIEDRITGL